VAVRKPDQSHANLYNREGELKRDMIQNLKSLGFSSPNFDSKKEIKIL